MDATALPAEAPKIICDGNIDALTNVRTVVANHAWLVRSHSDTECHDIHAAGATKGDGLRRLAKHLDIDLAHGIAFGDADTKIITPEAAGTGFAMGEAIERVIAAADRRLAASGSGELEVLLGRLNDST